MKQEQGGCEGLWSITEIVCACCTCFFFANTDMAEEHFGKPHFLFREFTRFSPSKSEFKSNELQAKTKRLVI